MSQPKRYSLPWVRQGAGDWTGGPYYAIRRIGNSYELRFRETLVHTGLTLTECMDEADRHRGIKVDR